MEYVALGPTANQLLLTMLTVLLEDKSVSSLNVADTADGVYIYF